MVGPTRGGLPLAGTARRNGAAERRGGSCRAALGPSHTTRNRHTPHNRCASSIRGATAPERVLVHPTRRGLFDGWHSLTFLVTAISGMFLPPAFGFLGFDRLRHPVRGLAATAVCLVWAAVLFGIGVGALGVDPVEFLIWVPVPLLFGGLIVLPVFRDSLIPPGSRAVRGVLNVLAFAVLGVVLVWIYQRIAGLTSPPVTWGPPTCQGLDRERHPGVHLPAAGHPRRLLRPVAGAVRRPPHARGQRRRGAARHLTSGVVPVLRRTVRHVTPPACPTLRRNSGDQARSAGRGR